MVSLASMNLALRGLPDVRILKRNVLTTTLRPAGQGGARACRWTAMTWCSPIHPFPAGSIATASSMTCKIGTSTATELLFVKYMIDNLKPDGRCGVVVPEGVLFGSTGAHKEMRRMLMQNNRVEAVLSLPGGVFQPYSGVKTSVLVFAKGGRTERVMFLHASNDGFKLDANHDQPIEADDLPGLIAAFNSRAEMLGRLAGPRSAEKPWTENWWFADVAAIEREDFNLSASRYRPESREAAEHRDPRELLEELQEDARRSSAILRRLRPNLGSERRECLARCVRIGATWSKSNRSCCPRSISAAQEVHSMPRPHVDEINGSHTDRRCGFELHRRAFPAFTNGECYSARSRRAWHGKAVIAYG